MLALPSDVLAVLRGLPERLDDVNLALVDQIANAALSALPATTPEHFASCLRSLSILPRRADDDCTGEQRVKIYARLLGEHPAEAISHMTRTALERCKWFPTVAECIEMLAGWKRDDDALQAHALAGRMGMDERRARFDDLCARARELTEDELAALPASILRRMEDRMLLWRLPSGRYVPRTCTWAEALAMDDERTAA